MTSIQNKFFVELSKRTGKLSITHKLKNNRKAAKTKELTESQQRFVELQVGEDIQRNHLQKIELILDNHKCSIEGRLNSEQIIKLLALLEETSC